MAKLENWSINKIIDDKGVRLKLEGNVYSHSRLSDGEMVTTTTIQKIDLATGTAETKNTVYELGEISLRYKAWMDEKGIILEDYIKI